MAKVEISGVDLTTRDVNTSIKDAITSNEKEITIKDVESLNSIAVGIQSEANIELNGDFGDFIGALNDGAEITINGSVNKYLGDNMTEGEIILNGGAGDGVGFGKCNGNIVVRGNAGDGVGQLHKNGVILIDGNIGKTAGLYMLDGDIIITGNSSKDLGDWMIGGAIYIAGSYQLGYNAKETELTEEDKDKLNSLFKQYDIDQKAENFTKIVKDQLRPFYGK
ncbi:tributyrin esterase [Candidatus Methanosphaera massiliense]|jgi:glutamate synthase domain-containing protein 3|uniref:GltB/FmdC/FwdC-like GXGXG domain-containing protein n=1 Tax=Methanosphaera TaxID=2316 RepID=UPI000DC58B9A|nr:tributyrin esterase [Candidatus Methanosphaera massiliense]MDD6285546.1 tributyrin esterase [Methanobacteriaceae archaeon]MDE4078568.1 tributyrin esterase [Candidatus Methanosphaera massiliense]MDY2744855.1 tributyrin esterase [Methanosphaera sp.]RAP43406.1 MAG: tributyrin esterase [Methanosphaera sp. SHI1033]